MLIRFREVEWPWWTTTTATAKTKKKERCKDTWARKGVAQWFATGCTLQQMAHCPGLQEGLWFNGHWSFKWLSGLTANESTKCLIFWNPSKQRSLLYCGERKSSHLFTATKHKRQGNDKYFYEYWGSASICTSTTDMELQYSQTFERSCLKIFTAMQRCVYNHNSTLVLENAIVRGKLRFVQSLTSL